MTKLIFALLFSALLHAQATMHYYTAGNAFPVAKTYTCTANGTNWVCTGQANQAQAAATSQTLTLFTLPANGYVLAPPRIKTLVACTGTTTLLLTGVGLTGSSTYFAAGLTYDLKAAVANTNILNPALSVLGSNTAAATDVTVNLTSTVQNISSVASGCSFSVSFLWLVIS